MDAQTEQALRESIEKWKKNSRVRSVDNAKIYNIDCPLCVLCNGPAICRGCPVSEAGFKGCVGSPWGKCYDALVFRSHVREFRAAAREEVAFLESLLPGATP